MGGAASKGVAHMCTEQVPAGSNDPGILETAGRQAGLSANQRHDAFFDGFPPEWSEFREQVLRIAPQEISLLLSGETGTGKTRLGRLVHELSSRAAEPSVVIDCGAVP